MILRQKKVLIGITIFGFLLIFCLYSFFYPVDPLAPKFAMYLHPSLEHPFGTDVLGRDIFAQCLHGAWLSLKIGVIAGSLATLIGVLVGGIGGYFGKLVDEATSTLTNVVMTIPTLALLIVVASFVRVRNEWLVIGLISIVSWAWTARAIRAAVLSLKTREFIDIAKQSALSRMRILIFEVLPNILAYVIMAFAIQVGSAIIAEASLSAIGLGPSDVMSLGIILRWAISFQASTMGVWWWIFPPGALVTLYAFSLLLVKDGLDEVFNPKTRK